MSQSRRTRWLVAGPLLAALVVLGACGDDDDDDAGDDTGSTPVSEPAGETTASEPAGGGDPAVALVATADLSQGEDVFGGNCAQCHGDDGGGGFGPSLENVAGELTVEEEVEVVRDGRGNMPSWDDSLSDEEIAAVVRYTREGL